MHLLSRTGIILAMAVSLFVTGAHADELSLSDNASRFSSFNGLSNDSTDQLKQQALKGLDKVAPLEENIKEKANAADDGNVSADALKKKKPVALLTVEPSDSSLNLNWVVSDLPATLPPSDIRYAIHWGMQSEQYKNKVEVGTVTSFKLRELKNNQPYFIRVRGYNKEGELIFSSKEVTATPLAVETLGSRLEKAYAEKPLSLQDDLKHEDITRDLKQFGYDFFTNSTATLSTMDNYPVGDDYRLGPGDGIKITLWGGISGTYDLTVDRNGEITIPKVGAVRVWGLEYSQLRDVINRAISHYYRNFELNVTLGRIRTIQIFVVGEVKNPGTYSVSSMATVINALSMAGGAAKNGSLRHVSLVRSGKTVQDVDLYDVFLSGDRSRDVRLQNGDTIFVPVIGPVVAVTGEVKRPAIYELKGTSSLKSVLEMAGSITAAGDTGRVQVERLNPSKGRTVVDYDNGDGKLMERLASINVDDRDMVKIFPLAKQSRHIVTLAGNVQRPGQYQLTDGMRLKDLLPDYSVLLPGSYADLVKITRLSPPDYHTETLTANLRKAIEGDAKENILLQEQDIVTVFPRKEMQELPLVTVAGQVVKPDSYEWFPNMTVRDLITAAGSVKRNAYLESAELKQLVVEGGQARSVYYTINLGKALAGDPQHNKVLCPGDALNVRGIVDWAEAAESQVLLKGEVRYPGHYAVAKGEKLSSVIARAGGFTDKAYLPGAKFTRKSVQEEQQKRLEEVVRRSEQEISKKQGELASLASSKEELEATKASLEGLQQSVEKLKTLKAEGRVVLRLDQVAANNSSVYDIELQGGDTLDIPFRSNIINVLGEVYNPTSFVFVPDSKVGEYVKLAGGPTRSAEASDMYLIKADGTVVSRQQSFGFFGSFMSTVLESGDTLVVPQKLEQTAWLRDIKDITTIISQIALTAGTVLIGLK